MRPRSVLAGCAFALGLSLVLLWAWGSQLRLARAAPTARYVSSTGVDDGEGCTAIPCRSIQHAVNVASPGDTIYVAGGTYTGTASAVVAITKSITLHGGWDGVSTSPEVLNPISYPTVLDGENSRRVVYISGTVAPKLEGFTLQRGNASGLGGDPVIAGGDFGGAVYASNASPVITDCRILSSTAGFGGGLALYYGAPTVGNSVVLSNTANQTLGLSQRGVGGGMFLYYSPATIEGTVVMSNVATGDDLMYDGGGGLYIDGSRAVVRNSTIEGNNGRSRGGGLYIYQSIVTMRGNTIADNDAALYGGGLYMVMSSADLEANTITGNEASRDGGGLIFGGCAPFTLTNNIIAQNSVQGSGPALYIARFQETPWSTPYPSRGRLLHNTLADNNSSAVSWMIHVGPSTTLAFTNTIIDKPGGITVAAGSAVFLDTTLWSPSLLLQPGLIVSGAGSIISATNYYSATGVVLPTYHLAPTSAAIDLGVDAGVTVDIDGDSRPQGAGHDIGADEHRWRTHLPLFLRDTP